MPFFVGFEHPVFALANSFGGELFGAPYLEPPILAPFVVDLAHRAPEVERLHDRLLDQRGPARSLHHRRRYIA